MRESTKDGLLTAVFALGFLVALYELHPALPWALCNGVLLLLQLDTWNTSMKKEK